MRHEFIWDNEGTKSFFAPVKLLMLEMHRGFEPHTVSDETCNALKWNMRACTCLEPTRATYLLRPVCRSTGRSYVYARTSWFESLDGLAQNADYLPKKIALLQEENIRTETIELPSRSPRKWTLKHWEPNTWLSGRKIFQKPAHSNSKPELFGCWTRRSYSLKLIMIKFLD